MSARTIQTPAVLRRDTRFQACTPGAKWVFGHLCDRREIVAEPGHDVLGTVALIVEGLGDTPREVLAPLLAELERERGLVTMEPGRLVIHTLETAADRPGPRGGKAGAVRMAELRARRAAEAARAAGGVTANPSRVTVTVTDSVTSHDPSQTVESDGCDDRSVTVTGDVTGNPSHNGRCDGSESDGPSPEVSSPHSPLLPNPNQSHPPRGREADPPPAGLDVQKLQRLAALEALDAERRAKEAKRAAAAAKRTARREAAVGLDPIPPPGTPARRLYDAIVGDPALRPIVAGPGDFAVRVTADGAFPGVDVLAEVQRAGEYAATKPGQYTDGRAYLRGWLQREAKREAARPKPAAPAAGVGLAPRPATARAASGPLPAAPRSAFEHATLAGRLGLRWRAPTDGADRDAAFLAQTGLTVDEARRRVAALPAPTTPALAPAGAPR